MLNLPVVDEKNLPDLTNTEEAFGIHEVEKRQLGAPGVDALTGVLGNLPLPVKNRRQVPKLPFLQNDDLPDLKNTLGAVGIKPGNRRDRRQLPSLPLIDNESLPNLDEATKALGIDTPATKRQIPSIPFVDEEALPDLGELTKFIPAPERRGIVPGVPVVDEDDLPNFDRTVGAFGIASTARARRRRQLQDTDVPILDESQLPDIANPAKALGLWEKKRQLPSLPFIDSSSLPDLESTEDSLGLNKEEKREFVDDGSATDLDQLDLIWDENLLDRRQIPDVPIVDESALPDFSETAAVFGITEEKRQLPSLPFVDESALPDLSEAQDSLGLEQEEKRQLPDLPFVDESVLPNIDESEDALGIQQEKRQLGGLTGEETPLVGDSALKGEGSPFETITKTLGLKNKRGFKIPILDKGSMPNLNNTEKALGIKLPLGFGGPRKA